MQPSKQDVRLLLESGANVVIDGNYFDPKTIIEMVSNKTPQTEHLMGHLTIRVGTMDIKHLLTIAEVARKRVTFDYR